MGGGGAIVRSWNDCHFFNIPFSRAALGVVAATCNLGLSVGIDHWDTVFNAVMRARECLRVRVGW